VKLGNGKVPSEFLEFIIFGTQTSRFRFSGSRSLFLVGAGTLRRIYPEALRVNEHVLHFKLSGSVSSVPVIERACCSEPINLEHDLLLNI
jgi:hypothetical protein